MTAREGGEPAERRYVSEGLTLSYANWGGAGRPTLLLLHGMADHARSWDRTARALGDRFHVVAADLRGHGDSAWSPDGAYLLPYHVLDMAALADALGEGPLTIVAHSFGGSVASRWAALYPDRVAKLVLVEGLGPSPETYASWAGTGPLARMRSFVENRRAASARPARRLADIDEAAGRMIRRNAKLSPEQARHLAAHGTKADGDALVWKFDPRVSMFAPEDFAIPPATFWPAITAPTLILFGVDSGRGDPRTNGYADGFADARVVGIEDAGHWPHHDQFDAFIAALHDFLG